MAQAAILERIHRDFEAAAADLPASVIDPAARRRAADELERLGWPSGRDEQWRYANLRQFERVGQFGSRPVSSVAGAATDAANAQLPRALPGFERWVFIDGIRAIGAPTAGTATTGAVWGPEQRLGLLSEMFGRDAAVIDVGRDARIEVLFLTSKDAAGAAVYPRLQVRVRDGAHLQLVERHLGDPAQSTLVNATIRIDVAAGSQLSHYRLQQNGAQILFGDTLGADVAADATYRVRQVAVGSVAARTSAQVQLSGRAAALDWQAIAVGRAEQVLDMSLRVDHLAPGTRTQEVFRGIADEHARLAFNAHVHISAQSPGSEARQSLRGLIEGARAEVDLRPRLEIYTDDVRAQHGATTGQLDENLLFYLLARGLDAPTARALLKWAFLGDVLRAIDLPDLRAAAEQAAAHQLPDVMASGALT
ncbi:MAG TPA: SufD family Fe-S cluster assembly protein [Steroidobacteraceae bacterium]|jgi:Fe-S cluster assembly protein SufD|nr:SufD family Fe-S cluster assembly protein [Steroidobacteraceae bacterium]